MTVTWDQRDFTQAEVSGSVTFAPSVLLTDTNDGFNVNVQSKTYHFVNGTGSSDPLVATDNGNLSPSGWTYLVTVSINGLAPYSFNCFIAFSNGASQKLSSLVPVSPVPSVLASMPLPSGTATAGYVPVATGNGEASTWTAPGAASLPLTTLGDTLFEAAGPTPARLPGNTSSARMFLRQQGTGTVSAPPAWDTIQAGDLPTGTASVQGALQLDGTAGDIQPVGTALAAGSVGKPADAGHVHVGNFSGIFGDGSDGAVTFDGSSTVLGLVPASGVYTLNRDIYATSFTVTSAATIKVNGWRIFAAGAAVVNGTLLTNGNNATGTNSSTGGTAPASASIQQGAAGASGGTANGGQGTAASMMSGVGTGQAGGAGSNGTGGGTRAQNTSAAIYRPPQGILSGAMGWAAGTKTPGGAGGGGAGGGDGTNAGGGGGSGGGMIAIFAWSFTLGATGVLQCIGGNGGSPSTGNCGGGGGGGGGIVVIYTLVAWTNNGTTNVSGGNGGSGSGTGASGTAGGTGTVNNFVLM